MRDGHPFLFRLFLPLTEPYPCTSVFELNGEVRAVLIEDRDAAIEHVAREKAVPGEPGSVGSPMAGVVIEVRVKEGQEVKKGDPLVVLSAMSAFPLMPPVSLIVGPC